ncbi:Aste57867_21610 [Aphanomyces stellatus]|uniref:Aste57867_21610 protein n=1 Tax=Aphanomyces stellatus TaxID=120398 RepID=A0A485LIM0_9STRA|nr:hypothetical protein As57867_021541 [Aphanomyces stellatus]VFT98280.1 Aste57867_21610 [Aphanomyces stellatus]
MHLLCPVPLALFSIMTTHTPMPLLRIANAGKVHPFGDDRSVFQSFPSAIPSDESDPFLMCDNVDFESEGAPTDPDHFPIGWHPHRGMDIVTYMKTGVGRHADSMGNRESFVAPGMQWMSCGSGIMHAEGGGTPEGSELGFQIWINVPASKKMNDPSYGTEPTDAIPAVDLAPGVHARLLAGPFLDGRTGAFKTQQPVQMVDFELDENSQLSYTIPHGFNTAILYVYEGAGSIGSRAVTRQQVALFDATDDTARGFELSTGASSKLSAMLFAGVKLREPIVWHGPIVMNTRQQIQDTFQEIRSGTFPPTRVPWDYKDLSTFPKDKLPKDHK